MRYVLGIDLGTSSTKTVLFDEKGRRVAEASKEYPLYQPENGWAEQEPGDWYDAAVSTIRQVLQESKVDPKAIVGLGMSGQMHGLVLLDEAGKVCAAASSGPTSAPAGMRGDHGAGGL